MPTFPNYLTCKMCDYRTINSANWKRHLQSTIHKRITNSNSSTLKCKCGKSYKRMQNLKSHMQGCKVILEDIPVEQEPEIEIDEVLTCDCGKTYKHRQSLYRHKRQNKCGEINKIIIKKTDICNPDWGNMINDLIKENREMRKCITELVPKIGTTTNHTTIHNNSINIFLNEKCKNALNLTDFIGTLTLELEDLEKTRSYGYIRGISNIFIKNLKQLDTYERPIHCSDVKRDTLYIKDNNVWEKDGQNQGIKQAINTIAKKQIDHLSEWVLQHPNWKLSESETITYMEMVRSITDAGNDSETIEKKEKKIIKNIAKEVILDK